MVHPEAERIKKWLTTKQFTFKRKNESMPREKMHLLLLPTLKYLPTPVFEGVRNIVNKAN